MNWIDLIAMFKGVHLRGSVALCILGIVMLMNGVTKSAAEDQGTINVDIEFMKSQIQKFETMINTADEDLAEDLIDKNAKFFTPASSEPLEGGKGYLSVVYFMRSGFPDVQWHLEDLVAEGNRVAVNWICTGTHTKEFMGVPPTGNRLKARFMNFYYFNEFGKIVDDVASEGMIAIMKTIGLFK